MGIEADRKFSVLEGVHAFVDGLQLSGRPDVDSRSVFTSGVDFFSSPANFPHAGVNQLMVDLARRRESGRLHLEVGLFLEPSQRVQGFRREPDRAWVIRVSKDFPSAMKEKTAHEWSAIVNIAEQIRVLTELERNPQVNPALTMYLPFEAQRNGDEMELDFLRMWKKFDPFYA